MIQHAKQATTGNMRVSQLSPEFRTVAELDDLVGEWRIDALKLDRYGNSQLAQALRQCADALEQVSTEYTTFVDEAGARVRAGLTANQFTRLARRFRGTSHVRTVRRGGRVYYRVRACLLPPLERP